jgi:hypothetical protein
MAGEAGIPLILAFSRREKGQPLSGFVKSVSSQAESRFMPHREKLSS